MNELTIVRQLRGALKDVFGGGSDISAANPLETHDPTIADVEAALAVVIAYVDELESRLTAARAGYLDQLDFDLAEAIAAIPTTMRGTDGAALAASWTAALATALGNYTAAKAAFLDEAISAAKVPKSTDESDSFPWDTSEYTTAEQDISALFTTALTGATRRKYSVYLDLTGPAGDGAAWTKCTIKVKVKVDGTNYRTIDKKDIAKTDVAAAEEPGVPIDIPPISQDAQITAQFDVALGSDQTIHYHYVKGVLE